MIDFENQQRELFRGHIKTNISAFASTSDAVMTILSTRTLIGRLDTQQVSQSLGIARAPAWATISVNLHNQLKMLAKQTVSLLGTRHAVAVGDMSHVVDQPMLAMTLPQWLATSEIMEQQRTLRAMRAGYALSKKPLDAFTDAAPFSVSNSSIGAITITAATSVMNRVALAVYSAAGITQYKLATNGDVRDKANYSKQYDTADEPVAPLFIGDRSYPVPA